MMGVGVYLFRAKRDQFKIVKRLLPESRGLTVLHVPSLLGNWLGHDAWLRPASESLDFQPRPGQSFSLLDLRGP